MKPAPKPSRAMRPVVHLAMHLKDAAAYVTKDGSLIRELAHPAPQSATLVSHGLSLAEATVPPGGETFLHRHPVAEEIYHFLSGQGSMTLGDATFPVVAGDTVVIAPGTLHSVRNSGPGDLRILCACAPPYAHDDTELAALLPDVPAELTPHKETP